MVIHWSAGGLYQEDVTTSDRFLDLDVQLAIGEAFAHPWAIGDPEVSRNLSSQSRIGGAAEQTQTTTVLLELFLFGAGCCQKAGHGACRTSSVVIRW